MDDSITVSEVADLRPLDVVRICTRHLLALLFPLTAFAFLVTGPHRGWSSAIYLLPIVAALIADSLSPKALRQPHPKTPALPFDFLLLLLVGIQLLNIFLTVRLFSIQRFWSLDALVAIAIVGATSGYSGIVVAHELIHRREGWMRQLGRILLCTVMYEHFYTEHVRGHHVRVGTLEDPATAHFGESFARFFFRTVPGQLRSAWRLETKRLGDEDMPVLDPRLLRSRVVHGLVAEWTLAAGILILTGPAAFFVFLLQALFAIRALEVVNYFEHWGLLRTGKRVQPIDSWDTDSAFTYYALTGLTRHADHHAYASRPYQQLRVWQESPRLPRGYIAMFPLVIIRNRKFRDLMTSELERCRLGPFLEGSTRVLETDAPHAIFP
jgi:alkane 1-monooxygenase